MRTNLKLTAVALLWCLGMAAVPTQAQQTAPMAVTTPADTPPPIVVAPDQPLVIPAPPQATIMVEMDLRDDDLLGVFKSFLKGVGQGANAVPMPPGGTAAAKTNWNAEIANILSNADLSDVLKDVTHVHFILFQLPGGGMAALMPASPTAHSKLTPAPASAPPDQTNFYETAFTAEGGHRIVYINTDPVHVLMTSFGHTRGSAMMVQAPGMLAVLRADGYPDLSKLTALATSLAAAAVPVALNNLPVKKTP